jgi:hypothetical protein
LQSQWDGWKILPLGGRRGGLAFLEETLGHGDVLIESLMIWLEEGWSSTAGSTVFTG